MARMTPTEAFVETLVANGVTDIFGIMGSAFMARRQASVSSLLCMSRVQRTWPMVTHVPQVAMALSLGKMVLASVTV